MRIKRPFDDESIAPEMTSLIDIMFLLIIFFMVTTTFETQGKLKQVRVDLPHAEMSTPVVKKDAVVLGIGKDGGFFFDDKPCDAAELANALALRLSFSKDSVVVISGHKNAPYASVVFAYDVLQALGIKRFSHEVR
jgi:biopolymer transport protein ExbD